MSNSITEVQKAYLAYLGRPADPTGATYWMASDAATMNSGFAGSAEYASLYSGMTSAQRVEQVYANLLGRASDAAGKAYWVTQLDTGRVTISSLVLAVQAGATGTDIQTIANRVAYAIQFTNQFDTPSEVTAFSGATDDATARAAVATVTYTDASLTYAENNLAVNVAAITNAPPVVVPPPVVTTQTINLTAGADTVAYNTNANLTVNGLGGADTVTITGNGDDTFNNLGVISGANTITINGNGNNAVNTGADADTVTITGTGKSTISAGDGHNTIDLGGVSGTVTITTGIGSDIITAGSGGSSINAGAGDDTITGGAGVDNIKFIAASAWNGATATSPVGLDTITQFTGGIDILSFSDATFHGMTFGGMGAISGSHIGVFTGTSQLLSANTGAGNQSLAGGVTTIANGAILLVGANTVTSIVDVYVADGAAVTSNTIATEVAAGHVILVGHVTIAGAALTAADFGSIA